MSSESSDVRRCGRPTRSGAPCRAQIYGRDLACKLHTTDHEREVLAAFERGWSEGLRQGRESEASLSSDRVRRLERRIAELETAADEQLRIYEVDGSQAVEVGRYSYRWDGEPQLVVGEKVLLPENWLSVVKDGKGPQVGTVTALGTRYQGQLSRILRRVDG